MDAYSLGCRELKITLQQGPRTTSRTTNILVLDGSKGIAEE
jgi:hypothetical protein